MEALIFIALLCGSPLLLLLWLVKFRSDELDVGRTLIQLEKDFKTMGVYKSLVQERIYKLAQEKLSWTEFEDFKNAFPTQVFKANGNYEKAYARTMKKVKI